MRSYLGLTGEIDGPSGIPNLHKFDYISGIAARYSITRSAWASTRA